MPRKKSPPVNLDKYLEGRGKTYISYAIGAKMYSMPYWTFVSVAKEAGATWALRKTAIVDMEKLDAYLDEHYLVTDDRSESEKREVIKMPKQIVDMLGISEKDLLVMYKILNCVASSNNSMAVGSVTSSLWINSGMDYNEEFLLQLNKDLNLASYVGEMGTAEMNAQITEWINETTGNLLADSIYIKTTRDTLLELLNSLCMCKNLRLEKKLSG